MLEYIIENYRNDSQFINDFDALEKYLKDLKVSTSEKNKILREVFEYNSRIYSIICEENKRLEKIISSRQSSKTKKEIPTMTHIKTESLQQVQSLDIDVSAYVQRIKSCKELNEIDQILPDKKTSNCCAIYYTVLLKLYEEVIDIKRMVYQERNSIDTETSNYFKNEIDLIMFKINYIKQFLKRDVKKIEPAKKENELIFLKTNYGNVCALSDLKDIPQEYYDQIYELLESICDGSLKNFKTFTNNESLKGLSEVKGDSTRIIVDRVANNVYIVLYMFVKKTDKNASYKASLQNRNDLYKLNYDEIKKLVDSPDYLEENRTIKEKLYRTLTKENKVKKLGGING